MNLPGGFHVTDSQPSRRWDFVELNGLAELNLWEKSTADSPRTDKIDTIIGTACTFSEDQGTAANLCQGDRHYLLSKIAGYLSTQNIRLTTECLNCCTRFDTLLDLGVLPIKPAGDGFPLIEVEHGGETLIFRVPTSRDQAAIYETVDEEEAKRILIRRCYLSKHPLKLSKKLIDKIDDAFEVIAPEIAESVQSLCIECKTPTTIPIDLARIVIDALINPLEDIHDIATAYHWSEFEILAMPKARREHYLDLIEREAGIGS